MGGGCIRRLPGQLSLFINRDRGHKAGTCQYILQVSAVIGASPPPLLSSHLAPDHSDFTAARTRNYNQVKTNHKNFQALTFISDISLLFLFLSRAQVCAKCAITDKFPTISDPAKLVLKITFRRCRISLFNIT